jgi:type II secretory pathway component GspD/PulD (secretin)
MKYSLHFFILMLSLTSFSEIKTQETFDFSYEKQTDIKKIIKDYANLMQLNTMFPTSLSGSLSIITPNKIDKRSIQEIFYNCLKELGLTAINIGNLLKITKGKNLTSPNKYLRYNTQANLMAVVVNLRNTTTDKIIPILTKISNNGSITSLSQDSLYIIDIKANTKHYQEMIKLIDASKSSYKKFQFYQLKHLDSKKAISTLNKLKILSRKTKVLEFPQINSLGIYGSLHRVNSLKEALKKIDVSSNSEKTESIFIIPLDFTFAKDIIKSLKNLNTSKKQSKMGLTANEYNNSIILRGTYENYYEIKKIIKNKLDIKRPQVLFKINIIELAGDFSFDFRSSQIGLGGKGDNINVISGWEGKEVAAFQSTNEDKQSAIASADAVMVGVFLPNKLKISGLGNITPSAFIKTLENSTFARNVTSPLLLSSDSHKISLESGDVITYIVKETNSTGITSSSIEKEDATISLEILPKISHKNYINLSFTMNISSIVGFSKNGLPRINTKKIKEEITIKNKQTAFIAGHFGYKQYTSKNRIPIIEHIPLLGALTTSTTKTYLKTQTLVLITPHIIYGDEDLAQIYKEKTQHLKKNYLPKR